VIGSPGRKEAFVVNVTVWESVAGAET